MQISLLRTSLLRFFKTITKILLMQFYGLFCYCVHKIKILLMRLFPGPKSSIRQEPSVIESTEPAPVFLYLCYLLIYD